MMELQEGIVLRSGTVFNYNNPGETRIPIEDIAFALSNVCRFAGHIPFYSVAQHCVNVSMLVPKEHALTALLHDTAEAVTNDLPTPLKMAIPAFKDLEVRIESALAPMFGFQFPYPAEVKYADLQMLLVEKVYLKKDQSDWAVLEGVEMPDMTLIDISKMNPVQAREVFLDRYDELTS